MPTRTEIKEIEEIRDPYPKDFAGRLRAFRKKLKIKQTEFAEMLQIDIQKCRRYESIGTEPDVETLKKMASILKITVDELIGYKPAAITIAVNILKNNGIIFKNAENNDAFILYRYKNENEDDAFYFDSFIGKQVPLDDQDPELLEVYTNEEALTFAGLQEKYGFKIYKDGYDYTLEKPKDENEETKENINYVIYTYLTKQKALATVANGNERNLKVLCNEYGMGNYKTRTVQEFLSHIKTITLTSVELKACVFEARRQTDAIIKAALNATYAAFFRKVFCNYINDEKYSTWSVETIDMLPKTFPERLRSLRERCNFSQSEMAEEVGLSLQTYNRYETKNAQPSIDMLKRLALKFGISVNTLTGFKLDYLNEALVFLDKVHIKCKLDEESQMYRVEVPGKEAKVINSKALHFCVYQAKEDTDDEIADDLKNIFVKTFTPIFWELVNNHQNLELDAIIDENDYEPYLYELDLMNKPDFSKKDTNENLDD